VTKIFVEVLKTIVESANQPQMFLNGLTLAHYVGCISKLTIKDLTTGVLPNLMGRGLTIPQYLFHTQSAQALPELIKAHKSGS